MAIQCAWAWNLDSSVHWKATGGKIVGSQCGPFCASSVPIMQTNTGLPLWHHWMLASGSVVPVESQWTCGSSGIPVCSSYVNDLWIATRRPLGDSISQCGSSVVCPVVSQCTEIIWFGVNQVRSLPSKQPHTYTTQLAWFGWAKLISFELQLQIHKNIMVLISKTCTMILCQEQN